MLKDKSYQSWSLLQRLSQQMMFTAVIDTVERTLDDLIERSKQHNSLGTLELDNEVEIPKYLAAYDIHQQPGGYHTEKIEDDIAPGVVYDISLPIYSRNSMGDENDLLSQAIIGHMQKYIKLPEPERMLDIGCAIGNSTLPFAKIFPNAEIHGIDVASPCLRYAHARANALGVTAHFSQQNAEQTNFENETFDLITSCLLLHETSHGAIPKIINEAYRLLRPGGWMMHLDVDPFHRQAIEPLYDFLKDWEIINNNENFSGALRNMNLQQIFEDAGFSKDTIEFTSAEADGQYNKGYTGDFYLKLPIYLAQKPNIA